MNLVMTVRIYLPYRTDRAFQEFWIVWYLQCFFCVEENILNVSMTEPA